MGIFALIFFWKTYFCHKTVLTVLWVLNVNKLKSSSETFLTGSKRHYHNVFDFRNSYILHVHGVFIYLSLGMPPDVVGFLNNRHWDMRYSQRTGYCLDVHFVWACVDLTCGVVMFCMGQYGHCRIHSTQKEGRCNWSKIILSRNDRSRSFFSRYQGISVDPVLLMTFSNSLKS